MANDRARGRPILEWAQNRERSRALRPRDAALVIGIVWLLAVVVWGVLEALVDPKTFPTVWLGMWWALQTVTTVGYGDVVPVGTAGRIIATFLLVGGLAFLTVIIAMITVSLSRDTSVRRSQKAMIPIFMAWNKSAWSWRKCAPNSRAFAATSSRRYGPGCAARPEPGSHAGEPGN
jgi:voltage-gated potassium channel